MKKFISASLTLALAISMIALTSCGGSSSTPANSSAAPVTSSEANSSKAAAQPRVLKLGHQMAENVPEGKAMQFFADQVKERTNGEIQIVIYPSEQLGDANTSIDSTKIGSCDLTLQSIALFASYDSMFNIGTIPFLFENNDIAAELNAGEIGQKENEVLRENGLQLVNSARNFFRGPYRVLVSKKPVNSVDDVTGLRFRAYENKIYMEAWNELGANPIIVSWGETYSALMQGTVDAATSTIGQLYGVKFTEVAPYVANIREYTAEAILVANAKMWDSLTDEQRTILTECANEAGEKMTELTNAETETYIQKMKDEHNAVFTDVDTSAFREKLTDFYYKLEADGTLPKGLVDRALGKTK